MRYTKHDSTPTQMRAHAKISLYFARSKTRSLRNDYTRQYIFVYHWFLLFLYVFWAADAELDISICLASMV